ncbi:rCG50503, partial [Rattus norvegicus]
MAPEIHMPEPICLIANTDEHLVTNQEALEILSAITQPVVGGGHCWPLPHRQILPDEQAGWEGERLFRGLHCSVSHQGHLDVVCAPP